MRDYAGDPRVTDTNGAAPSTAATCASFADGVDDDGNGYVDDLSGWDADDDDGDEFDHRYFGHGTGRAGHRRARDQQRPRRRRASARTARS